MKLQNGYLRITTCLLASSMSIGCSDNTPVKQCFFTNIHSGQTLSGNAIVVVQEEEAGPPIMRLRLDGKFYGVKYSRPEGDSRPGHDITTAVWVAAFYIPTSMYPNGRHTLTVEGEGCPTCDTRDVIFQNSPPPAKGKDVHKVSAQ